MRSNFAQPQGVGHQGVFPHAYSPTDAELLARARAWLAAGGTLVRAAYTAEDGSPGSCWWVQLPDGRCLDGLAGRIAEAVAVDDGLVRTEAQEWLTKWRREG